MERAGLPYEPGVGEPGGAYVRCGPFALHDENALPTLLYAFACLAARDGEEPEVTFDEADDCVRFLDRVRASQPDAASVNTVVAAKRAIEAMVALSEPLSDEHRAIHETPRLFDAGECSSIIATARVGINQAGLKSLGFESH